MRLAKIGKVFAMAFAVAATSCGAATLTPENAEVVVEKGAPDVVNVAGRELSTFLSRSFGRKVPVSETPTAGRVSVVLGERALSKAAGIDLEGEPTDTFVIKADGDRVYIAGRDDAKFRLSKVISGRQSYSMMFGHDRATLHGVYDFLERYAGVRFYFPDDELGTVVPKKGEIVVPDGIRKVTPDFLLREPYFGGDGRWHVDACGGTIPKTAHWMRLRLASTTIPCCHGSRDFHFVERFGKSHPEYLAMKKDGTVRLDMKQFATSQYCWSNPGFREELYQDVKAYLTGQPASSRGLKSWSNNCRYGKWVDIMPEDSFQGCFCSRCQAAYGEACAANDPDYASELVWGAAAEIGNRLINDGIPGNVTMMCYRPYRRVPDFALPTNLWVMVAENGPWSLPSPKAMARQYGEIRAWKKKLGHKVWAWTYPSKYGELMIKGVPCVGPHAWGKYYADLKDDIIGGFCECECDRSIYNFLNYYVYSRVMWDASTDIDAVLDELYADLFGAASGEMKRMFSELERRWTTRVVGNIVDTPIGPKAVRPDNSVLWGDIYSPEFRREMDSLLKAATAKVGADSLEARRIALMRAEFYDNMVEGAAAYESQARAVAALRFDPSKGPLSLMARSSGLRGFTNVANVATSVIARRTPDALEFSFTCAEPKMALCSNGYTKPGDPDCWRDNGIEIVLNPSGDGKTMFHYILTSAGNLAGQRYVRGDRMSSDWRGYLKGVKTSVKAGDAEWTGTIALPLSLLGETKSAFKINFSRHRMLTDGTEESMTWSPHVMNFHDLERFGTIDFAAGGLAPFVKLVGTGDDDTKAVAGKFKAKAGVPYVFSCEMRHPAGKDTGVAIMSPAGIAMYASPRGHGWDGVTNAFMSLSGPSSAECVLRQWHIPGEMEFRNARVSEAVARYRRVGGVELGFGESMDGGTYRYSTLFSRATHNHSRPVAACFGSGPCDGAAKPWKKGETYFMHEIGGRTILSARVGIAVDGGVAASTVSVSRDGAEWVDVISASNTGVFHADLPAGFLPAKRIFARVKKGMGGKAAKFRQYMFDAEVDGPAAFGFGATDYLDATTGETLLSAKPLDYIDDTTSGFALSGAPEGVACWTQSSGRKVFRGRPAPTARGEALKIAAARNEAESAQLVLRPDRPLEGVRVTAEMPDGIEVEIRRVGYVLVDLPMDSMGARGMWPDPIFDQNADGCDVAAGMNQPFWVTAKPRRGTKAGTYRGEIKVAADGGMPSFSVPLEVRVFDFDFPDRVTCETAFGLAFSTVFEYHHAKDRADRAAITEKYLEMFSRHHISPYSPYSGIAGGTYTDKWTKTADPADSEPVFSWDAWDDAVSNALCRYNFNTFKVPIRGLGSMNPLSRGPRNPRVINGVAETNSLYEVYMERYLKAIEDHLRGKGWLDKAYIYAFDEPQKVDYGYMKENLERLKRYAPSMRRMVTMEPRDELEGAVSLWCPITEKYDGEKARARQKAGDDLWWYITFSSQPPKANEHIEHSGVDMRVWLWQTWLEKVQGVLIWETACWNRTAIYPDPERPQNPYEDSTVWTKARPWNSGEGKYIYPPEECFKTKDPVIAGPVDSIRFEMLREGVEDYEYFAMLSKVSPDNPLLSVPPEITSSLEDYSFDPAGMESYRVRLAEAIGASASAHFARRPTP